MKIFSFFYKKLPTYNPQMTKGKPYSYKKEGISSENYGNSKGTEQIVNDGERYPLTVQVFKKDKGLHPTQKPSGLWEELVNIHSNESDVVLDCFSGSGVTGVTCKKLNRNFIGIELDETYCGIANKRIEDALSKKEGIVND